MGDYRKAENLMIRSINLISMGSKVELAKLILVMRIATMALGLVHLKLFELKDAENRFRRALETPSVWNLVIKQLSRLV